VCVTITPWVMVIFRLFLSKNKHTEIYIYVCVCSSCIIYILYCNATVFLIPQWLNGAGAAQIWCARGTARTGARADSWWCARMSLRGARTDSWRFFAMTDTPMAHHPHHHHLQHQHPWAPSIISIIFILIHASEPRRVCRVSLRASALLLNAPPRLKPLRVSPQRSRLFSLSSCGMRSYTGMLALLLIHGNLMLTYVSSQNGKHDGARSCGICVCVCVCVWV